MTHITPTPGRIVWYFQGPGQLQPLAAIVVAVNEDATVNLAVFSRLAEMLSVLNVHLVQPDDEVVPQGRRAEWMPYQVGQAKKHEDAAK